MSTELIKELRDALAALLDRDTRNTCTHEETHRGGSIWEICDQCGLQWADDRGGKPKWKDPDEWGKAQDALDKAEKLLDAGSPLRPDREVNGLEPEERTILVNLLYDKVEDYSEICRKNKLAASLVYAISEEQKRLKLLATKISR